MAVSVPSLRPSLIVAGIGAAAATQILRSGRGIGVRGGLIAIAVGAIATHYRPAVAVVFALVVAAIALRPWSPVSVPSSVGNPERS